MSDPVSVYTLHFNFVECHQTTRRCSVQHCHLTPSGLGVRISPLVCVLRDCTLSLCLCVCPFLWVFQFSLQRCQMTGLFPNLPVVYDRVSGMSLHPVRLVPQVSWNRFQVLHRISGIDNGWTEGMSTRWLLLSLYVVNP